MPAGVPQKLLDLKERLVKLKDFIPQAIHDTLVELAPVIEDLLADQLQRGERGDGTILPDYSPVSVHKFGKPPGPIRLKDTGAFYRGMKLVVGTDSFEIDDTDLKTPMLTAKYGDSILKLSPTSLQILRDDYLVIEVNKKIKTYLQLQ